jgi:low affinity Fe/Cu permease
MQPPCLMSHLPWVDRTGVSTRFVGDKRSGVVRSAYLGYEWRTRWSASMSKWFMNFSNWVSEVMGSPWAFLIAGLIIIVWATTGPVFHYSDTWQLVINTGTTIVTFLMVFLIQNTQNRDARAIHLKLDEIIRAMEGAQNQIIDAEDLTQDELNQLKAHFAEIAKKKGDEVEAEILFEDVKKS